MMGWPRYSNLSGSMLFASMDGPSHQSLDHRVYHLFNLKTCGCCTYAQVELRVIFYVSLNLVTCKI